MKRSEMVMNLARFLMSRLPEWEKSARLEFADELLSDLEIEGMLPPSVVEDCSFGEFQMGTIYKGNYWEPEDE